MQTRIFLILSSFCFISFFSFGQDYKFIYYLDENLSSCEKAKSVFIGKALSEDGLIRLDCFNKVNGDLILSAHFTDSTLSTFQGLFQSFYPSKKIENEGNYLNGVENGVWKKWNDLGDIIDSCIYDNGKQIADAKFNYFKKGHLVNYIFTDSINHKVQLNEYNEDGILIDELTIIGNSGVRKEYNNGEVKIDSLKIDSVFSKPKIEASFPGSEAGWRRYLLKNLNPNIPVNNGAQSGTYTVIVRFIVNEDGTVGNVTAETNNGFGMEQEAIRIIKNGPKWIPAMLCGYPVKAYRRQPITFVVGNN